MVRGGEGSRTVDNIHGALSEFSQGHGHCVIFSSIGFPLFFFFFFARGDYGTASCINLDRTESRQQKYLPCVQGFLIITIITID